MLDQQILVSRRNSLIGLLLVLFFCEGWVSVIASAPCYAVLLPAATSLTVTALLITLSQLKNRPLIRSFHWLIYFIWPIVLPICLIRYYHWKGLLIIATMAVAYVLVASGGYYLAVWLFS